MDNKTMNTLSYVKNWVSNKESISFFLPSGSYGRPFDNQNEVEEIIQIDNGFMIKFSKDIVLIFNGNVKYEDEVCNLILKDFDTLKYVVSGVLNDEFDCGEFCLTGF